MKTIEEYVMTTTATQRAPAATARLIRKSEAETVWHVDVQTGSCNGRKQYHAHVYQDDLILLQTVTRSRIVSERAAQKIMPAIRAALAEKGMQ